jgi:hypothetical protein
MKVRLTQEILQLDGTPFPSERAEGGLTLQEALATAINAVIKEEGTGLYHVAVKVAMSDQEVELTSEEITTLKRRVTQVYLPPVLVGRICDMLDGKEIESPVPKLKIVSKEE